MKKWINEFYAERWDRQIEQDIKAGKLDKLASEALADFEAGLPYTQYPIPSKSPKASPPASPTQLPPTPEPPWEVIHRRLHTMGRYDRSKTPDPQVQQVLDVLAEYEALHPNALIEARINHYDFIEIRIIDPDFQGMERISRRENKVWPLLYSLPDEIISDIMGLVLVTPEEAPHFGPSIEFDYPLPPLPILGQAQNNPSSPCASQSPTTPSQPSTSRRK